MLLVIALSLIPFFHPKPRPVVPAAVERHRVDQWRYEIDRDNFTGGQRCRLSERDVSYGRKTLTFRFSPGTDTSQAVFRIEDGPAHPWTEVRLQLLNNGVPIQDDSVENPSRGLVRIPAVDVGDARWVWIRSGPRTRPRRFVIAGLRPALAAAQASGCDPDKSF
jgi:hypothetical protein